jgi:hypothetical protein
VTDDVARMETAAQHLAARGAAIPERVGTLAVFLGLAAMARLDARPGAGWAFPWMAVVLTSVLAAHQQFGALLVAAPCLAGTSPDRRPAVAAMTAILHSLRARGTWAGMTEDKTFVVTAGNQRSPALLPTTVWSNPRVESGVDFFTAIARVAVGDVSLVVNGSTFWT